MTCHPRVVPDLQYLQSAATFRAQDFFIDRNKEELILICNPYGVVIYLDMDFGNFIKTMPRPDEESYIIQMHQLNDSIYTGYSEMDTPPVGINLIQYDANSFEIKQKAGKIKDPLHMGHLCLAYYNNSMYYYGFFCDTLYDVTDINLPKTIYYLNSGKDTQYAKKTN